MMIIFAIERSSLHRRIALKVLLVFGCSHYRLSFILFFTTMFSAMWLSDIIACGLMMPLVKAILMELERVVAVIVIIACILQTCLSSPYIERFSENHRVLSTYFYTYKSN
ncbi:unnamed protein product [Diatraea saccharalis]|uniref:Uncharacterized protein n=1 Tax=Diatraea saccharalis TaxID=40085 RepID=A0A9N9R6N0_9NEOP|nr:unnamed protein product [Diatraea saccharalis]